MKLQSINPTTEESIGEFELCPEKMVSDAVDRAKASFKKWSKTDILERENILKNFSDILAKKKKEIAELITKEIGKPIKESEGIKAFEQAVSLAPDSYVFRDNLTRAKQAQ